MTRSDKLAAAGGRVILTGIFKNESATIAASLDSVKPVIDCIALVDTGSTDGTPDVVRKWMADNGVPGVVYECPWPELAKAKGRPGALFDFAEARNLAQSLACNHAAAYELPNRSLTGAEAAEALKQLYGQGVPDGQPSQSWLLEIDACWYLRGGVDQLRDALAAAPANVTGFDLDVMQPGTRLPYLRLRRVSECWPTKPTGWRWRFGIHEALWRTDNASTGAMRGVWFDHVDTTTKEVRFARFERDLLVLDQMAAEATAALPTAEGLARAHLTATISRCAFYKGQTLENLGRAEEALAAYEARAALEGVTEDWAVALTRAGRLAFRLERPRRAVQLYTEAHAVGGRPEPLWYAADVLQSMGDYGGARQTAALAFEAAKASKPTDFTHFVDVAAWSLAKFGAAASAEALAARRLHMQLLGAGLPLDEAKPAG